MYSFYSIQPARMTEPIKKLICYTKSLRQSNHSNDWNCKNPKWKGFLKYWARKTIGHLKHISHIYTLKCPLCPLKWKCQEALASNELFWLYQQDLFPFVSQTQNLPKEFLSKPSPKRELGIYRRYLVHLHKVSKIAKQISAWVV